MKKSLLTLGVATVALSSFASTRVLYQQNFENVTSAEEAGWSFGGESMSIASDSFGKFLELTLGQNNGRSGQVTWGQDIYMEADGVTPVLEDGIYNLMFDFCIKTTSNNQYNSEITVFTNHAPIANNRYRDPWSQSAENSYWQTYVFDMVQDPTANAEAPVYQIMGGTTETTGDDGAVTYAIDYSDVKTLGLGEWYTVDVTVNTVERTVEYSLTSLAGDIIQAGEMNVPENNVLNGQDISMFAEGLFALCARYQTVYQFDNILVTCETEGDYANTPTVALTRLGQTADEEANPAVRAYTITFFPGETLHVIGTNGQELTADYDDCEGAYEYETTTSGTLTAYTTVGDAKSEEVKVAVDCAPVVLPGATVTISSVSAGYGKTYTLTVSNADVPMRPTIFIDYEFVGVNGEKVSAEGLASGCTLTVTEEGTLSVTTAAFGYQSTTITEKNNLEFETKKVWDFARMDKDELKNAGFADWTVLNSDNTSGFNNWTARKRLFYYDVNSASENEEGEIVYNAVYPFGFESAESTTQVIDYCDTDGNETGEGYFDGLNVFAGQRVSMLYRIGLYNPDTSGGNYKNIVVNNLDETDFVVVNYINNYGGNSNHPIVADDAAYYEVLAGEDQVYSVAADGVFNEETETYTVTHPLYRIDTACTKITVFKQNTAAVEGVEAAEVVGDNYWYSIDGVRVAEPTRPGLYIHNGKKIIVK